MNVKDYDDRTPLHIAGEAGLTKIYNILLKGGANPNAKDIWGKIPNLNDEKTSMHNESKGGIEEDTKVNMMKKTILGILKSFEKIYNISFSFSIFIFVYT